MLAAEVDDGALAGAMTGLQFAEGLDLLTELVVGNADDSDVLHVGVPEDRGLDLGRVDIDAAGDDHVLGAIGDEEIAVIIELADVADAEEPLGIKRIETERHCVQIAADRHRRPDPDLAGLVARKLAAIGVTDADLDMLVR